MSAVSLPLDEEVVTIESAEVSPLLPTYKRAPMQLVRGEGVELIDTDGKRYLDFASGIAVNALGYRDPGIAQPISDALSTGLIHPSNLYRTPPGAHLPPHLSYR